MHLCPCRSDDGEQRGTRHAVLTFPASSSQYVDQIVAFIIPHSLLILGPIKLANMAKANSGGRHNGEKSRNAGGHPLMHFADP